jgi:hypothetical protein
MKVAVIKPQSVNVDPWLPELSKRGITVLDNYVDDTTDFIIGASHSQSSRIFSEITKRPNVKLINYNWDLYPWAVQENIQEWQLYGNLLSRSVEVWAPSNEVITRTREIYGDDVANKSIVLKTFARFFKTNLQIEDKRYIYNPLRNYYKDPNYGWTERAGKILNIPVYKSEHKLTETQFQEKILGSSFMVCEYHEASTGGLTLLEGYYHGKPALISDSPYMGAIDYFGDRARYFKHDSFDDFLEKVNDMWVNTPNLDLNITRTIEDELSLEKMIDKMVDRLRYHYERK